MEKLKVIEESFWDIKKIGVFVVILGVVVFGLKTLVLDKNIQNEGSRATVQVESVKSDKAVELPSENLRKDLNQRLSDLKEEVNNINVVEVATSTPAVQKVLSDLKNLQNVPQNQAKQACFNICNGL